MNRISEVRKVLTITLALNILVSGAKIAYGFMTHSVAISSDGFHSLFDGISNVVGLIGVYLASHPADERHPYGHRKYETVFTIFIGVLMLFTCFEIFKGVYDSFAGRQLPIVGPESFILMVATTSVNIFVTLYEKKKGKELASEYLIADAGHTRSDIYVSLGVIVSLVLTEIGLAYADAIAGAVVGIFVAKAGFDIIKEAAETLIDKSQVDPSKILQVAECVDGVVECHHIRTRGTSDSIFVDLHCLVHPELSVDNAHGIAHKVEAEIRQKFPAVVDVVVHLEPAKGAKDEHAGR
ncbi:MAG TPA: cation diffusion facilitator family transporter [Dissulfurispiraceae bacterium]|nr:cation diffusion facilitator family transporter [Dissulfurispiraceae bacterium]